MTLDQHLLDRLMLDDEKALREVAYFLGLAEQSWNRIDRCKQSELAAMHHAEGSLPLCLLRAMQAVDDLIAAARAAESSGHPPRHVPLNTGDPTRP